MFNGDVVYICRLPCIDGFDTFFQFGYCCHQNVGLLTPVFKNKGNIAEVINYRGITVLPVINKIIETIIKNWINTAMIKYGVYYL
jgi:hypothetical protein